ncbi:bifunctional 4-hydroxy-2-oxoglutarate aldolase/2-dehydro-3-deoxy-phosphogluconate aldolase [Atopobacter sp. AH10]|uniref:bifunctional 4-hydroxy-2-oxoglutarate aldolase/2-dehydro-3-deoxy-phosphogluconate aldolase n=1 Tax=Atopobacter sp. AH10 TaxID=2315861 RepID=UPI000EF1BBDA|nr:bifunctional 4-hydroxy-2-oxoglutarate aldolase/2-dehydro-3-deoxy-phosphogluconate aldolase [Atopobacter sp. AH10]RLK63491.1 bifunctional 4-hydroxy-2-oxoglutarate aldolase/2-dehydro-3-deoxy-phosphogluconate aldolase [Atopobacter sp. AH10]
MDVLEQLKAVKLMPLYTATDLTILDQVAEVLITHHVPFIEVTFRSDLAGQAIKKLSEYPELVVGAGTVTTIDQAEEAVRNGAKFIVTPAISRPVVEYCLKENVPIIPGTATPRDIQIALEYGLDTVKFFPANIYGGIKALKALSGPFPQVKFLPTGGVNEENLKEYLDLDAVVAVGGSFILSEKAVLKDNGQTAKAHLGEIVQAISSITR